MNNNIDSENCACQNSAESDVIICRCEEVYLSEINDAIQDGVGSLADLRRITRAGMGLCQGRTCGRLLRDLYSRETGKNAGEVEPNTTRPPVRPMPLSAIGSGIENAEFQNTTTNEGSRRDAPAYINQVYEDAYDGDGPTVL